MQKRLLALFLNLLLLSFAHANNDFDKKYTFGKELLTNGKYLPAMEVFLPLTQEEKGNHYVQYAHYFYALAALKGGKFNEGYQMLLQLKQKYPQWKQMNEANYLFANIAFELKKYRYGLNALKTIDPSFNNDVNKLKSFYFSSLQPIDSLKAIQKSYPTDPVLGKVLAQRLNGTILNERDKMLFDYLCQEFKLDKIKSTGIKKPLKDSYNVAVLFPFMLKELNNLSSTSGNYVIDLYSGIRAAVDSLKKRGVQINLYSYDVGRDNLKLTELLKQPEFKNMDLLIGPLLPTQSAIVHDFALRNQINVVNPISNNSKILEGNPMVYLFQPALESQAGEVANYNSLYSPPIVRPNVIIFYSDNPRDSLLATYYKDSIISKNYKVTNFEKIDKSNIKKIGQILKDTAALGKVNHLFVASAEAGVAANVVSALEMTRLPLPVFTRSEWLSFPMLSFEQLERRKINFIFPEFLDYNDPDVNNFKNNYIKDKKIYPSPFAFIGYELMNYFGNTLKQFGPSFGEDLRKRGVVPGEVLAGIDYIYSNDNSFVPIVKIEDLNLKKQNEIRNNK